MKKDLDSIALEAFKDVFSGYAYPFKSSDEILRSKDDGHRAFYYEKAKSLTENDVLQQEIQEWKRNLYAKLALQSMTDVERTAYRATLIAIVDFEKRFTSLAALVHKLPLKRTVDNL